MKDSDKENTFSVISAVIGGLVSIALVFVLFLFWGSYDYQPIYILNNDKQIMATDSVYIETVAVDSVNIASEKVKLLKEMEQKGILLTPQEYTSHITGYFSAAISFLIFLFIIFSAFGYWGLRILSKKDVERTIDDLMDDSIKFRNRTTKSISAIFSDTFASKKELEELQTYIEDSLNNTAYNSSESDDDSEGNGDDEVVG